MKALRFIRHICLSAGARFFLPGAALAEVGRMQIDVAGAAPNRAVTYADFDSFQLMHDPETLELLQNAAADSNSAALSKALARSRTWSVRVMRVLEGGQPRAELRDVHLMPMLVNCSNRQLYARRVDRVRKDPAFKGPYSLSAETYTQLSEGMAVPENERWHQVLLQHTCSQQPWRQVTQGRCLEIRVERLGMDCLSNGSDYDVIRLAAAADMRHPAQHTIGQ